MSSVDPDRAPVLLVASGGGHLTQLEDLSPRFVPGIPRRWVTFDTDQSRSLLADEDVDHMPYVAPRAFWRILKNVPQAWRILRTRKPSMVVSTGAGVALAYLPLARLLRIETHYIESATRAQGPSLTGRILSFVPGIQLHTQHRAMVDRRWSFVGSVFEGYEAIETETTQLSRCVVCVGTIRPYGFERLLVQLNAILPADVEVVWQTGVSDVAGLPIDGRESIPSDELEAAIEQADIVVAHAGTGTALTCLRLGKRPILVPRRAEHGEHVDDHQEQTARFLDDLGLAAVLEADQIKIEDLESACAWVVRRKAEPASIRLSDG